MYSIKKGFEDKYVFVLGNTKKLSQCNEQEIAVLQKSYRNWFVKKTDENSGGELTEENNELSSSEETIDSGATITDAVEEVVTRKVTRKK